MVTAERHIEAMERVNGLVSVRERNCAEVRSRLLRYGFTEEEADDAVQASVRCGLVSEERYTRAFMRGKASLGWGRDKILARLRQDGIPDALIDACADEMPSGEEEYERALHELERRPTHSSNPYASLMRRLVGKGYPYDVAKRAVKDFLAQGA